MSADRPKTPGDAQEPRPEESVDPGPKKSAKTDERETKKSPRFRMARLDGRDTLKYEDTADK